MHKRLIVAFSGLLLSAAIGWAQDAATPAKPGSKAEAFNGLFSQWKNILVDMRQLGVEYRQAQPPRRAEIEARYGALTEQGKSLLPKLTEAAEAAVIESPQTGKAAGDFLLGIAAHEATVENYEAVLPVAKPLIDHAYPDKQIYAWAGIAAFTTGEFDLAAKYLKLAEENSVMSGLPGDLSQNAARWLSEIPYYQDAWKKEKALRAAEAKADDLPRILFKTSKGDIELELFENEAPNTVANFISLVEKGFYNGTPFHRVLQTFMAQGGDPTGTGSGGPGHSIRCECYEENHRLHFRGTLSMAHAGKDTGGSQFFLTFVPTRHLDGKHTVFGRVVKGMEVLSKLKRHDPGNPSGGEPDKIVEAKVLRKRNHPYEPKTLPDPHKGNE
ncbi:MAG: peptidylprolyl isomerase [Thermoguttaceae bacterium]